MRNILSAGLMLGLAGLAALPAAATPFNNQSISNLSIGGTTYTVVRSGERTLVTWEQGGRTCIVGAPKAVPASRLVNLAASF